MGAAAETSAEVFAVGGEAAFGGRFDVKAAVVLALFVAGLIEADIAAGVDGGFTAAAVQRGTLIDRVFFTLTLMPLAASIEPVTAWLALLLLRWVPPSPLASTVRSLPVVV